MKIYGFSFWTLPSKRVIAKSNVVNWSSAKIFTQIRVFIEVKEDDWIYFCAANGLPDGAMFYLLAICLHSVCFLLTFYAIIFSVQKKTLSDARPDSESANVIWKDVGVVDAVAWTSSNQKRQHRLRPRLLGFNSLLKFATFLHAGYLFISISNIHSCYEDWSTNKVLSSALFQDQNSGRLTCMDCSLSWQQPAAAEVVSD